VFFFLSLEIMYSFSCQKCTTFPETKKGTTFPEKKIGAAPLLVLSNRRNPV